jgi:hypothetical protein
MRGMMRRYGVVVGLLLWALFVPVSAHANEQADASAESTVPVTVTEKTFKCLSDMTPVRGFFLWTV